jgi:hypothetical protein
VADQERSSIDNEIITVRYQIRFDLQLESGALLHRFGIVDASLGVDASKSCDHLPRTFSGRCHFCELVELDELYVRDGTYIYPTGHSWYRAA